MIPGESAGSQLADARLTEAEILRLKELAAEATAPATRRAYDGDWKRWVDWCAGRCLPLPADPAFVALYIEQHASALDGDGKHVYAPTTLKRWVTSINQRCRSAGVPAPGESPIVRVTLAAVRRTRKHTPKKRAPLLLEDLRRVNSTILADAHHRPARIAALRDVAVLGVGFFGAFRRSEVAGLRFSDLKLHPEDGLHVRLRESKTDQEGEGEVKPLPREEDPAVCPVCAVLRWAQVASAWDEDGRPGIMRAIRKVTVGEHVCGPDDGLQLPATDLPLFRSLHRSGIVRGPMTGAAVNEMIQRRAEQAGLAPERLVDMGGHSLRAGFVTEAYRAGARTEEIARQTGHKSHAVLAGYQREAAPLRGNAVVLIGRPMLGGADEDTEPEPEPEAEDHD